MDNIYNPETLNIQELDAIYAISRVVTRASELDASLDEIIGIARTVFIFDNIVLYVHQKEDSIEPSYARAIGRGSGQPQLQVAPISVAAAIRRAQERCRPGSASSASCRIREPQPNCGVGQFLNISPNGDVFPCHVLTSSKEAHLLISIMGD